MSNYLLSLYVYEVLISVVIMFIMIPYLYGRIKAGAVNLFTIAICICLTSYVIQCIDDVVEGVNLPDISHLLMAVGITIISYLVFTKRFDIFIVTRKKDE